KRSKPMVAPQRWWPIRYGKRSALAASLGLISILVWTPLLAGQECGPSLIPDAPVPAGGPFECPDDPDSPFICDLQMLFSVSPAGRYTSDDLRIGDPVGTPQPERPWIAVDAAGNRFYKIFSRFANTGSVP